MTAIMTTLRANLADRRAASATEYALAAGILALGIAPAFTVLAVRLNAALSGLSF